MCPSRAEQARSIVHQESSLPAGERKLTANRGVSSVEAFSQCNLAHEQSFQEGFSDQTCVSELKSVLRHAVLSPSTSVCRDVDVH